MYLAAPTIGVATIFVPHSMDFRLVPVAGVIGSGFVVAAALAALPERAFAWMTHVAMTYAIFAITAVNVVCGSAVAPYSAFFFWPVLFAAWYLSQASAIAYGLLSTGGLAVSLFALPTQADGAVRWLAHAAAFALASFATSWSRARVDAVVHELHRQSSTDGLTGLLNRRSFDLALERSLVEASEAKRPVSLVLFDVDEFKQINDAHGHPAGDRALRKLARALIRRARLDDVVARIGGDEFAVILSRSSAEDARSFARDVFAMIAEATTGEPTVSASAGVAEFPMQAATPEALVEAADRAVYEAKRAGRRCVV